MYLINIYFHPPLWNEPQYNVCHLNPTCVPMFIFILFFYIAFNSQGHIAMGSLRVEEPVHTSWSRFCTVNHRASASNYQLSNMEVPGQRFELATSEVEGKHSNRYTTESPSCGVVISYLIVKAS